MVGWYHAKWNVFFRCYHPIQGYLRLEFTNVMMVMSQDVPSRLTLDYMMWATDVSQNAALAKDETWPRLRQTTFSLGQLSATEAAELMLHILPQTAHRLGKSKTATLCFSGMHEGLHDCHGPWGRVQSSAKAALSFSWDACNRQVVSVVSDKFEL